MIKLLKVGRKKIAFVSTRHLTIEVRTPFDSVLSQEALEQSVSKLLPYACAREKPCIVPLISFNSPEGRLHRVSVFFFEKNPSTVFEKVARILPESSAWTILAEQKMMAQPGFENLIFCIHHGNFLDAQIFMEGRLAYILRENFPEDISNRMERFKRFVEKDALLSRAAPYKYCLETAEVLNEKEGDKILKEASKDFFWRRVNLKEASNPIHQKRVWFCAVLSIIEIAVILLLLFFPPAQAKKNFQKNAPLKSARESQSEIFEHPLLHDFPMRLDILFSLIASEANSWKNFRGEKKAGVWHLVLEREFASEASAQLEFTRWENLRAFSSWKILKKELLKNGNVNVFLELTYEAPYF